ncbi:MAG: ABC transporter ATP-binding protein [Bacillota bacterium]|jgi:putative ABC transport system ATP-binding protein|nr:ABC transporter ATP-binding protein [Bacillota bacterium]HOC06328.1 ABC transporter ATP-binding protein [Bacillota bacterium]HPZ22739.1 ABC transporter ATP-binding protein [Bacillota bacterium]
MALMSARNLSKVFGHGETSVRALDDISLDISSCEVLGITGPSGAGKSTLLHILSTLDTPTGGQVTYKGADLFDNNRTERARLRRREFGFVFQFYNLVPVLTVEENIALPVLIDGKKPNSDYIDKLINLLGLESKRRTLPHKLSGGQQQRVAIGRALAAKPSIVFADEPTGNLDSNTTKEIVQVFLETASEFQLTLVIVTHDSYVASHCQRIVEIQDGNIISSGEDYGN